MRNILLHIWFHPVVTGDSSLRDEEEEWLINTPRKIQSLEFLNFCFCTPSRAAKMQYCTYTVGLYLQYFILEVIRLLRSRPRAKSYKDSDVFWHKPKILTSNSVGNQSFFLGCNQDNSQGSIFITKKKICLVLPEKEISNHID
jgi:hypothetical protein